MDHFVIAAHKSKHSLWVYAINILFSKEVDVLVGICSNPDAENLTLKTIVTFFM